MPALRNTASSYLQLDKPTFVEVRAVLLELNRHLRDAGAQDAFANAPDDLADSFKREYATKPVAGKLSALCRDLVFGDRTGDVQWGALKKGHKDESRFYLGVENLRALFRSAPNELLFDAVFSQKVHRIAGMQARTQVASAAFFSAVPIARLGALIADLAEIAGAREQPNVTPSTEFPLSQQDALEFQPVQLPELRLDAAWVEQGCRITHHYAGIALWSPRVSEVLVDQGADWDPEVSYRSRKFAAFDRCVGVRRLNDARRARYEAFNAAKVGLRTDILLTRDALPPAVYLQYTDYVDNLSTNDIAQLRVDRMELDDNGVGEAVEHQFGWQLFCDDNGTILGYSQSQCSNQLGASVLAVTDDGVPLLVQQLGRNIHSPGKIAPSGSGSFDFPKDFEDLEQLAFGPWLLATAQRELREELGICPEEAPEDKRAGMMAIRVRTMLTGFGALLHRGGLPNFFMLGRIHCTLQDLEAAHHYASVEKTLSSRLRDIKDEALPRLCADDLLSFCKRQASERREHNSVPLAMAYDMLIHLCGARRTEVDQFLQDDSNS